VRAIVLEKFGGLDGLIYKDISEPEPKAGHVVIQIEADNVMQATGRAERWSWSTTEALRKPGDIACRNPLPLLRVPARASAKPRRSAWRETSRRFA
jgi:hypothetical protein